MDITGTQSKQIREDLNLSQNKTAQGSRVNRGYLSMFEAGVFQLPEHYKQQLINFYASQGYLFTQNEMIIDNGYIDEPIDVNDDNRYYEEESCTENNNVTFNTTQSVDKEIVETSKIAINPKLANAILVITTLTIFHQIAKNNGFDIFDWIDDKLSSKKNNDYFDGFY
ncbi:helix-turn-helix domain-containing protein [Bathymodiolus septemdierum thioautotrophic gill symbiont]|uniref:Uncharacterized protein n=1 Tax=endosymbiont of Bathymodiolus septemdierum str. Myojin knoll TaxID=1303921 RepID=A0A0P0US53_9GAMM|nr:helix-turn-helix transcriptional regulator [Bathymodiolus septemdierum thioautotrophic gill symbiont]BAS67774.1 hypothetical protein BSEPE_0781 [endosymbiont of Bathymodiolus septemdierum str. Myojin knoll]